MRAGLCTASARQQQPASALRHSPPSDAQELANGGVPVSPLRSVPQVPSDVVSGMHAHKHLSPFRNIGQWCPSCTHEPANCMMRRSCKQTSVHGLHDRAQLGVVQQSFNTIPCDESITITYSRSEMKREAHGRLKQGDAHHHRYHAGLNGSTTCPSGLAKHRPLCAGSFHALVALDSSSTRFHDRLD